MGLKKLGDLLWKIVKKLWKVGQNVASQINAAYAFWGKRCQQEAPKVD